ncbi:MAG: hypothetical protein SchgKO_19750 [Schleiferiaceae bacterium]
MPRSKSPSDKFSPEKHKPQEYAIPVEGSLGILALGAVGIKAWREAIVQATDKGNHKENKSE